MKFRDGILVKTDKGRGVVPKNINWNYETVLVYLVDENLHCEKDRFHKDVKEIFDKFSVEIVGLVENGKLYNYNSDNSELPTPF